MRGLILSGVLLFSPAMADFELDELEQLDQLEQQDLLGAARAAAQAGNFSAAESYLAQARQKGEAGAAVQDVAQFIADTQAAKLAQEQAAAARQKQAEANAAAAQRQQASASTGSSGGGAAEVDFVSIRFHALTGLVSGCTDKNLSVSGGPGRFEPAYSGASSGTVSKYLDGIAGTYQWSAQFCDQTCSGSFYLSGKNGAYQIEVYDSCKDAGSRETVI